MKHSLVVLSLLVSNFSFAGTIGNGIKLSNLPTISKNYLKTVSLEQDIASAKESVLAECLKDKNEAEVLVKKLGSKVLSSNGCLPTYRGGWHDMGGSDYEVTAEFEVIFK